MSDLDRIINIQIDRQTKAVSQKGFGTMLLLGPETEKPAGMTTRAREYDNESFKDDYSAGDVVFEALTDYFSQALVPEKAFVGFQEGAETIGEALQAISDETNEWYALAITSRAIADQTAAAQYVQTLRKMSGYASDDAEMKNPASVDDLAFNFDALSLSRSYTAYNEKAENTTAKRFPECAWFGRVLPALPGSITWKFKTLAGQIASNLTGTERTSLRTKHSNYYNEVGGVDIMEEGWMADGSFIDEIRGVDWIHARMQEAIFARLVNLPKIPYTNAGVDIIVTEMRAVLTRAENQGILTPGFSVITKPDVRDIPFNDRASRVLPDLKFSAVLQGAIHEIKINGVVTV